MHDWIKPLDSRLHPQGVDRGCKAAEAATTTHRGNDDQM